VPAPRAALLKHFEPNQDPMTRVRIRRLMIWIGKFESTARTRASLFGRVQSSDSDPFGSMTSLSRGFSLLSGISATALPLWGQKNEAERSQQRPLCLERKEQSLVRTHFIHRPARDSSPPRGGTLSFRPGSDGLRRPDATTSPEPPSSNGTQCHHTRSDAEWSPADGRAR
jgi:hypothetical protein